MQQNVGTTTEEDVGGDLDVAIDAPEPWESWETTFVMWSLGTGMVGLVILGVLINVFILP